MIYQTMANLKNEEKGVFPLLFKFVALPQRQNTTDENSLVVTDYRRLIWLHLNDELVSRHNTVLQHKPGHISIIGYWFCRQCEPIAHVLLGYIQLSPFRRKTNAQSSQISQ